MITWGFRIHVVSKKDRKVFAAEVELVLLIFCRINFRVFLMVLERQKVVECL